MLKKIAHNSTIPALGGNRDLKALQNLIAAEKVVLVSLQKLSVDFSKASEALRTWGLTEGDYLGGILSASTSILNHFSSALSQYAAHGHSMRDHLKAIRTKEESLDELERRRRAILRKAEDADKKLNKITPDNKSFTTQTDTLNRLRDDIQTLNSDIMTEEAALDKFKRSATKVWMGLKFGGLVECCQKGKVAGDFGKLVIAEISEEMSQPGMPRSFIYPQNKIEDFVAEAYRGVNMVTLSTFPSVEVRDRNQSDLTPPAAPPALFHISAPTEYGESFNNRLSTSGELQPPPTSNEGSRRVSVEHQPPQTSTTNDHNASYAANRPFGDGNHYSPQNSSFSQTLPPSQQLGVNDGDSDSFGANARSTGPQYQQQPSQGTGNSSFSQTLPSSQQPGTNEGAVDDFGVNFRSSGPPYQQQYRSVGSPHPQRFSQGAVNPPFSETSPPSQQLRANEGAMDDPGANVRSSSPPHQQQLSQGAYNPSFSQTSPPSQQPRVNEGDFGANVRSSGPPYQQQFSQGTANPSFSQTLPSSRQLGANEGAVDDFGVNTHSTGPPYQQQFSQSTSSSSFSQASMPSQQIRGNEGPSDDFGANVRSSGPPYQQQFSQGTTNPSSQTLPSSRQLGANEGAVDDFGVNTHSTGPPYQQQFSQSTSNSAFSQASMPSQQFRGNEGPSDNFGPNVRSTAPPYEQQQFSQGSVGASFSQNLPPSQQHRASGVSVDGIGGSNIHSPNPQQFFKGIVNSLSQMTQTFSQTLPSSRQFRVGQGAVGVNVHSTGSLYPQQFSQGAVSSPSYQQTRFNEGAVNNFGPNVHSTAHPQQGNQAVNPSYSQTLPPSQQLRANEDDLGANVRSTPSDSPHSQQFSQGAANSPPSQQTRFNEGAVDNFGSNVHSTAHPQQGTQAVNSSYSQTLPPSQQLRDSFGANVRSTGNDSPHPQQFSQGAANSPPSQQTRFNEGAVDNFDSNVPPTAHQQQGTVNPSYTQTSPPSQQLRVNEDEFGANIRSTGSPHPQQFSQGAVNPSFSQTLSPYQQLRDNEGVVDNLGSNVRSTGPADSSSTVGGQIAGFQVQTRPAGSTGGYSLQDPGSGARPPKDDLSFSASVANALHEKFDDPKAEETKMPPRTSTAALSTQNTNEEDSRHVRFGSVENVNREIGKRISLEKEQRVIGPRDSPRNSVVNRTGINRDLPQQAKPTDLSINVPIKTASRRKLPSITPPEADERALNTAEARELSFVLEALKDNNLPPQADQRSQPPTPSLGAYSQYPIPPYVQGAYQTTSNLPTQQQKSLDMRNILPPRLQALNNNNPVESQVPPRFQNSSPSVANPLPPRFQTS